MRKSYVYKIMCKITGEYYFGSSFNAKSDYYWGGGRRIRERIAQYGKENFIKEILGEFDDRNIALQLENQYIEQFRHDEKCLNKRLDYHFGLLYGEESRAKIGAASAIAKRGEKNPMYGKTLSEEHRAKLYAANRGKHRTDNTRAKISAALCGKQLSEERIAKISAANRGKHRTDKFRAKISAAFRGKHWRKNPVTGKREWYD